MEDKVKELVFKYDLSTGEAKLIEKDILDLLLTQRKEYESIIDEVIGEDERVPEGDYHDKYVAMAVSCNDLREEQRQRAKHLLSKLEETK